MTSSQHRALDQELAKRIRDVREKLGLTRNEFARRIGVTPMTVYRWEKGEVTPSPLAIKSVEDLIYKRPPLSRILKELAGAVSDVGGSKDALGPGGQERGDVV